MAPLPVKGYFLLEKLLFMALYAVAHGLEGGLAVMALAAEIASVELCHHDGDAPLFLLCEHVRVMAVSALEGRVGLSAEDHLAHRALVVYEFLALGDGQGCGRQGEYQHDTQDKNLFHYGLSPLMRFCWLLHLSTGGAMSQVFGGVPDSLKVV